MAIAAATPAATMNTGRQPPSEISTGARRYTAMVPTEPPQLTQTTARL